jgi:class 3 adenylate cyclase
VARDCLEGGAATHPAWFIARQKTPDSILASREALEAGGKQPHGLHKFELKGIKEPVEAAEVAWES